MDNNTLIDLTRKLYTYNKEAHETYLRCRESGQKGDFFQEVKPFADQVKICCDEWEPLAVDWSLKVKPKNLHPMQIRNTAENIQMVSIRAFFPESSLKRFISHIQSIDFILQRMLEELDEE
ncbi:YppE family protein [Lederbergia sp. NSJ-179]|uniref:YppE family protein n=1 Tax=Lederbergia sp. NSJ-179 TaxID=2931402 RepID=UPI001FD157A8|nr:YppE family protein [Lederbergia sp. NSJ-179]MCJ7839493.1 YppE family protein [Lederbergia sp. NSJ-179]